MARCPRKNVSGKLTKKPVFIGYFLDTPASQVQNMQSLRSLKLSAGACSALLSARGNQICPGIS
jgi:hypothetical protein